jgi:drug/metabolite transporter (DMT)-like permease
LTGITINVLQDLHHDQNNSSNNNNGGSSSRENGSTVEDDEYPYKVFGDMLSMMGGILFGANKVLGEIAVKKSHDPDEYIGMQSLFAVIICAVQTAFTEMDDIAAFFGRGGDETCSVTTARWLLLGFVASNMIGYLGTARFLMHSEAAFFNLSLLTGDFWSAAFQIVAEQIWPASTFYLAAVLTLSGVLMYELASPDTTATITTTTDGVETFANGVDDDDDEDRNTMTLELAPTKTHGTRARNGIAGMQDAVPIPIV